MDTQQLSTGNSKKYDAIERVAAGALADLDGRTSEARRYRANVSALVEHLVNPPATLLAVAGRAAALMLVVNRNEEAILNGQPVVMADHLAALNTLRRYLSDLGIEDRPEDNSGPTLAEILRRPKEGEAA
ncbi:MAG: hypothetical protein KDJ29_03790 [Hyphomicrobiales bacterium]|nr:hypothetical protein [Hyphomicrobiales bacterium]